MHLQKPTQTTANTVAKDVVTFVTASYLGAIVEGILGRFKGAFTTMRPVWGFGAVLCNHLTLEHLLIALPILELITGLIFNKNHELWDYRDQPLNFLGQISLPCTGALTACALLYWFLQNGETNDEDNQTTKIGV